jgi:hypothetical protein
MLPLEIFVMLMLMVTEFLTQMTELTWESNTESDYGIQFTLNYFRLAAYTFASVGNDMVRNYERVLSDANRLNYVLDRWTEKVQVIILE